MLHTTYPEDNEVLVKNPGNDLFAGKNPTPRRQRKVKNRRVRFDGAVAVKFIEAASEMDAKAKRQRYCSKALLMSYRRNAGLFAHSFLCEAESDNVSCASSSSSSTSSSSSSSSSSSYSCSVRDAFNACVNVVNDDHQQSRVPDRIRQNLKECVLRGPEQRGLERWIVPALNADRRDQRLKSIQAVLYIQSKTEGLVNGDNNNNNNQANHEMERAELIAKVYGHLCKPIQMYARLMGEADAMTVRMGDVAERRKKKKSSSSSKGAIRVQQHPSSSSSRKGSLNEESSLRQSNSETALYVSSRSRVGRKGCKGSSSKLKRQRASMQNLLQ